MPPVTIQKNGDPAYGVKLVHFTRSESINTPTQVAFELTSPDRGQPFIHVAEIDPIELYNWALEKGMLILKTPSMPRQTTTVLKRAAG